MRKWISYTINGLLIALVAFFAYCQISMVASMGSNYGVPSVFGYSFLYVATDSMEGDLPDSLPVGSGIVIKDEGPENVQVGDIITFYYPELGATDTHRVHEIERNQDGTLTFYTRGDNLNAQLSGGSWSEDYREVVPESNYVGTVVYSSLAFGSFLTYVSPQVPSEKSHSSWVFPLLILTPLSIAAVYSIAEMAIKLRKEAKQEKEELEQAKKQSGIDLNDEAAVLAFEEKWHYKKELREDMQKQKEKELRKLRKELRRERR